MSLKEPFVLCHLLRNAVLLNALLQVCVKTCFYFIIYDFVLRSDQFHVYKKYCNAYAGQIII